MQSCNIKLDPIVIASPGSSQCAPVETPLRVLGGTRSCIPLIAPATRPRFSVAYTNAKARQIFEALENVVHVRVQLASLGIDRPTTESHEVTVGSALQNNRLHDQVSLRSGLET